MSTVARPAATHSPAEGAPRVLRVLVVDDDHDAAESLALLLGLLGHAASVAFDGAAALATAQTFQPDAVLLDLAMPQMDGFEVARRLREQFGKGLLLVATTGYGQDQARRCADQAGFDFYLLKPFDSEQVARLLAALAQKLSL